MVVELRVVIPTARYDESYRFYAEVLGWREVRSWADSARGVLFEILGPDPTTPSDDAHGANARDSVAARVELLEQEPTPLSGSAFCSVEVPDAAAIADALERAGATITHALTQQPWGHRNVATVDPNGFRWVFFSVVP